MRFYDGENGLQRLTRWAGAELLLTVFIPAFLGAAPWVWAASAVESGWHSEGPVRWRALVPKGSAQREGFQRLNSAQTGVAITNDLTEAEGAANRVLWNGSGGAAGDFNGDGWPDLYLCRLHGTNSLFLNLGGLRFRDVTEEWGLRRPSRGDRGAVFSDVNGDGRLDLLVATTGAGVTCYLNEEPGRFRDVTAQVGLVPRGGAMTLALADANGDGFLDLYVCQYRAEDLKDRGRIELPSVDGRPVVPAEYADRLVLRDGKLLQYGEPDILYLNDGRRGFRAVPWLGGAFRDELGKELTEPPRDWGLTATFRDLNGDRVPDLYVCNDFWTPDRVWLGDGKGGFRALQVLALRKMSGSSMGVDVADVDRDGAMDVLVVEMLARDLSMRKRQMMPTDPEATPFGAYANQPQVLRNTLFRARGDGTFAEIAEYAGLAATDWSWSPVFLDVDLDGYEDVMISAGHVHDLLDADARAAIEARGRRTRETSDPRIADNQLLPRLEQPVLAYRNRGDLTFEEVTAAWGTDSVGVNHALIPADFDQDGDLDLVVTRLGAEALVYENVGMRPRIAVRLFGRSPNGQGVGARVTLRGGSVPAQTQEVIAGGRYMAGGDTQLVFAPGTVREGMQLEVEWRSGRRSEIKGVAADRFYQVREPAGAAVATASAAPETEQTAWFEETTPNAWRSGRPRLSSDMGEQRQPLLHRAVNREGPRLAWMDWDGDSQEEIVVEGVGTGLQVFSLNGGRRVDEKVPAAVNLVAKAWEIGTQGGIPAPVALGDLDGDGNLECFVAGLPEPGRYPTAKPSRIYRWRGATWQPDAGLSEIVRECGLVRGAVCVDLDGDGDSELVLACEWGGIRLYRHTPAGFGAWDPEVTVSTSIASTQKGSDVPGGARLSLLTGWWNCVVPGDFDGDGTIDLVAGNWGHNSRYQASVAQPLTFWSGDWDGDQALELMEATWDSRLQRQVPLRRRDELSRVLPGLPVQFPRHAQYSEAAVEVVLGEMLAASRSWSVTTFASVLLLRRADGFEVRELPMQAQWSPLRHGVAFDANGDGHEDLMVTQNDFGLRSELGRLDAGRGLLLLGEGDGRFSVVEAARSGVDLPGEGGVVIVGDEDGDGRPDVMAAQAGVGMKSYRNRHARPGVAVRLAGPAANSHGVGAVLRRRGGERPGPSRAVIYGSGPGAMNSSTTILAARDGDQIEVRWPDGRIQSRKVGAGPVSFRWDVP